MPRLTDRLRPFTFNEKLALGMLALFIPISVGSSMVLRPGNVLNGSDFALFLAWKIGWSIAVFIAAGVAIATVFLKPDAHSSRWRMHIGRILPLAALGVAIPSAYVLESAYSAHQMRSFARSHFSELSGPAPKAVIYRAGIPDGGVVIVRSPGENPESFAATRMIDLTGEDIKSCTPLGDGDWSCHFD